MIKRILLPLDPSPYSKTALDMACVGAKIYDAEVTGLVILDIPDITHSIGPIPIGGIHMAEKLERKKRKEARERIESLLKTFQEKCVSEGVRFKVAERQGSPSEKIIEESVYYDIVIAGLRTYYNFQTSDKYSVSLDKLLKEAVTPVFGVPEESLFTTKPDRKIKTLIAFDGSPLSARAMQSFVSFIIPELYDITVLNVSEKREAGESLLAKAAEYLAAYNITEVKKEWIEGDIIDIIEANFYDAMDGFVVGAHARKGVFDFLIGSLTKYLVRKADKAVFIGQ